ncbi:TVP38/TMEM64 family protein [Marinimicrobium sp. ABcell2]|uniref:TVP38/TMEM64 family protein n=1 Tax=Marinimicrobium sp. ABcell2 TaxID=3069751 RepID=UPI0027B60952|nr:VTT domain-containing protein [Marinimicrobium sp. ABcell2]MDQ2075755.1 VTT domain-containing protein [Marinimicrobium sp. ABcell2]
MTRTPESQADTTAPRGSQRKTIIILVTLAVLFIAFMFIPLPFSTIITWGAEVAHNPFAIALILVVMAAMMTVGLPGSICFWLIAPFHPPLVATLLLLTGSLAGAIGGYQLSSRLSYAAPKSRLSKRITKLLTERSDLFTQTSLRVLPGFPHVLVNFTSGFLRLPLPTFILAAILGLTSKWAVYCTAVYGARNVLQAEESLSISTLMPLAILGIMLLISGQLKRPPKGESDDSEDGADEDFEGKEN